MKPCFVKASLTAWVGHLFVVDNKTQCLQTSQKSGIFDLIYSAQLKQKNNADNRIAVYYHPCNQNTNISFWAIETGRN